MRIPKYYCYSILLLVTGTWLLEWVPVGASQEASSGDTIPPNPFVESVVVEGVKEQNVNPKTEKKTVGNSNLQSAYVEVLKAASEENKQAQENWKAVEEQKVGSDVALDAIIDSVREPQAHLPEETPQATEKPQEEAEIHNSRSTVESNLGHEHDVNNEHPVTETPTVPVDNLDSPKEESTVADAHVQESNNQATEAPNVESSVPQNSFVDPSASIPGLGHHFEDYAYGSQQATEQHTAEVEDSKSSVLEQISTPEEIGNHELDQQSIEGESTSYESTLETQEADTGPDDEKSQQAQEETAAENAEATVENNVAEETPDPELGHSHEHEHDDHHHHHHHNHHNHQRHEFFNRDANDSSSFILVIKHLSSTLLSFLPEPLQDTILDVDDALVFTGIIALTLVSICVPYFLIEGYMSVRPLKKKVVELNKSLWKVSAAYETQQEEFEIFKQKAIAHDEFKKRAEQAENDVVILKKLETKQREQINVLKTQLKSQMKEAVDIRSLIEKTLEDKKAVSDECGKYKSAYENAKEALVKAKEELMNYHTQAKSSSLQLGVSNKNAELLTSKIAILDAEMEEVKLQVTEESEKRKTVEKEKREVEQSKAAVEKELSEIKGICHQYENIVSGLNEEISKLESELATIRESLGEDSPLLEVAEIQAKAAFAVKEADSLRTRLEGIAADNENLNGKLKETSDELEEARSEREQTNNRLQVLEAYFKEREEEYIKTIEQLQLKESVRDKGKEELIRMIEEKENVCKDLNDRLEALKDEFEETKQQHRNDIRALESKGHENWLSLCQAERKAQDAMKEAELLRQRLTAISKEKVDEDGDAGLHIFASLPHELVPPPLADETPSYFGLGDFDPPPPLPEGEEREPHRPPPLGGRLSPSYSDLDDNTSIDDASLQDF